jgi:hypothetical protein
MEPNFLDPMQLAALVVRMVQEIHQSSDERRSNLLRARSYAAWGRDRTRDQ